MIAIMIAIMIAMVPCLIKMVCTNIIQVKNNLMKKLIKALFLNFVILIQLVQDSNSFAEILEIDRYLEKCKYDMAEL
jgi:hypothetical protein